MITYLGRQVTSKLLTVVLISVAVFALFGLGPQSPASVICQKAGRCTQQREQVIEHSLGLDQPITTQYLTWAKGIFVDRTISIGPGAHYKCPAPCFGLSYNTNQPVREILVQRYPATLSVAIGSAIVELGMGLLLGSFAAKWRGRAVDRGLVSGSLLISSIPFYVLALVAWLYLVNQWNIFPTTGYFPITHNPFRWFTGLLLPWLVLGLVGSTTYARFGRGAMVEALSEDYIRSAVAKGVHTNTVIFKHALRSAIVPIMTIFGIDFASLLAGTYFTEYIFGIHGIGLYTLDAIKVLDYPVISATVLTSSVLIVVANLLVDMLYTVLDPRVRLS